MAIAKYAKTKYRAGLKPLIQLLIPTTIPKHSVAPVTKVAQIKPKPGHTTAKGTPAVAKIPKPIDKLDSFGDVSLNLSRLLKNKIFVSGIKVKPTQ